MKKHQQEIMVIYKAYNVEYFFITNNEEFLVLLYSDNMIRIADLSVTIGLHRFVILYSLICTFLIERYKNLLCNS